MPCARQAIDGRKPFDYDREIEGLRALDRYTLQFKVEDPRPRFAEGLAASDLFGAVAREVVEYYKDAIDAHPVGTGPFRLVEWRRSSRIVFERNPTFREMTYDAEPAADDAAGQALLARFKGRRLPMVDRVEISVIEQDQPRWLSFLNGEADFIEKVSPQFIATSMPGGKVAPNLAKRGIRGYQQMEPGSTQMLFNMESPVVGGYGADKVALRRALGLGPGNAARDRAGEQRPGGAGAVADHSLHLGLRPGLQERVQRLRPGAREGAARPLRLRRPQRRRLARVARRRAAGARGQLASPTSSRASSRRWSSRASRRSGCGCG